MASKRAMNFAAGPAKIPEEVIEKAHSEFLLYKNEGISVLELSHRGPAFAEINDKAESLLREVMNIPSNYKVIFLQGGGTGQFSAVPLNLCSSKDCVADYIITGAWSSKAAKEAEKYCAVNRVLPQTNQYSSIPPVSTWKLMPNASYVYYCSNETIHGIEFDFIPETNGVPLVCDMSSNILSKPVDVSKYGIIYAGAQKNIGVAGVTVVIVREDLIGKAHKMCPTVFDYKINADNKSLYNTPPTFSVYILGLVLQWIKDHGGLKGMETANKTKADSVYQIIDSSNGFYCSNVAKECRSRMNVTLRIGNPKGDEKLEKEFLEVTKNSGMISLKGHRSVGGIRISLFNAVTLEETEKLTEVMTEFLRKHSK